MYFQFVLEQERSRWYTYLNYLKERLQYQQFVQKFNDIPDIQLSQGPQRQLKDGPQHSQTRSAPGVAAQVAQRSHFSAGDEEATLKTKIVQAMKRANNESQTGGASTSKELDEQILTLRRTLEATARSSPEKPRLEKEYDALLRRKEQLTNTKEKLKLMFAVGLNHFCTHIGVTPLRGAYLPPSSAAEHTLRRVEPKIVSVHEEACQRLGLKYMAEEEDESQEGSGPDFQPSSSPEGEEIKKSETMTLKTEVSQVEVDVPGQQHEKEDYVEVLDGVDGQEGPLGPGTAEGMSGDGEFDPLGESMDEGMGAGLLQAPSIANKGSETGAFVDS